MEFSTLGELSISGKGSYGIAASAVPCSKELYTYLRITDITDDGRINSSGLMSVDNVNAEKYLLQPNDIVFARTVQKLMRGYTCCFLYHLMFQKQEISFHQMPECYNVQALCQGS